MRIKTNTDRTTIRIAAATVIAAATAALGWSASAVGAEANCTLVKLDEVRPGGDAVEVRGVQAGPFDPVLWQTNALHWVAHTPTPMLHGNNIYAPTVVRETNGWQVFYGGWDLGHNGRDHIYAVRTPDFRSFTDRRMIIANGQFLHVCNCSAVKLPDESYYLMATCCVTHPTRLNKPGRFLSPDSKTWNGASPYAAKRDDLIVIEGDEGFAKADINGMNVILYEDGLYRIYYCDFHRWKFVWRATSKDGKTYQYDGVSLPAGRVVMVNDVKKFTVHGQPWYLMALHANTKTLWYSLSRDGMQFDPLKDLTVNQGAADLHIVAVGLVCDDTTVYGFLYGASGTRSLNTNKIFAKWLQKRVEFVAGDKVVASCSAAQGPDRATMKIPVGGVTGQFRVFAEDGKTLLHTGSEVTLRPGEVWELLPAGKPARR
jgi:hypothetical protein